ncbi:hypothetical protein FB451DRAFT_1187584 [Mycena latifolia]|nr:hypothetical protein FB451DRAFT_1187584 [Mycena latifolia]
MKAFSSSSSVALSVAASASLIIRATATVQVGEATLLDPTVSSDTCGIPVTQADLYAAVAVSPGGDSRCGDTILVQFGAASVNLTFSNPCDTCHGSSIEITQAAYMALMAPVGPITVDWQFNGDDDV